jgi:hypothetical protein
VRVVRLETADETASAACPTCGVFSTQVKEYICTGRGICRRAGDG